MKKNRRMLDETFWKKTSGRSLHSLDAVVYDYSPVVGGV
jgi:hypothetical protein